MKVTDSLVLILQCFCILHRIQPNRRAAASPDSKQGCSTHLNVRARRQAEDTSVWLLTNYGWVSGSVDHFHFHALYSVLYNIY